MSSTRRYSTKNRAVEFVRPETVEVDLHWRQGDSDVLAELSPEVRARVNQLRLETMPENTRRTYESAWREFSDWCLVNRKVAMPASPATLIEYLLERSCLIGQDGTLAYSPSTLRIWVSAINKMHSFARQPQPGRDPLTIETLDAICRMNDRPRRQVRPITTDLLRHVLAGIDLTDRLKGAKAHRDYALLCFGMSGAFRRSELAALVMSDVTSIDSQGLKAVLRRSKTDQYARGQAKAIAVGTDPQTCPPCALRRWLDLLVLLRSDLAAARSAISSAAIGDHICGEDFNELNLSPDTALFPTFRTGGLPSKKPIHGAVVADVVKKRLAAVGVDAAEYSGHSLRAGFVTQAYRSGATTHEIMRQTGHSNPMTVEVYARETDPFTVNAVHRLGL